VSPQLTPDAGAPLARPLEGRRAALVHRPMNSELAPLLEAVFDESSDGVLATDATGSRIYSNPSFDALVGTAGRMPMRTAAPPPYIPVDQHRAYWRILTRISVLLAEGGSPLSTSLEMVTRFHARFKVRLTIAPFGYRDCAPVAVWWARKVDTATTAVFDQLRPMPRHRQPLGRSGLESEGTQRAALDVPGSDSDLNLLTRREEQVLGLILDGRRVSSIARSLYLSEHTVRNHLKAIFRKLGAHSQVELLDRFRPVRADSP
jgi:DNA-binding CsgD family transcriptional regulator